MRFGWRRSTSTMGARKAFAGSKRGRLELDMGNRVTNVDTGRERRGGYSVEIQERFRMSKGSEITGMEKSEPASGKSCMPGKTPEGCRGSNY